MQKLNKIIGKRIKQILKEKQITQYRLEQNTGLYHSTVCSIIKGKYTSPNFKTLAIIIQGLGISFAEFFSDECFNYENFEIE